MRTRFGSFLVIMGLLSAVVFAATYFLPAVEYPTFGTRDGGPLYSSGHIRNPTAYPTTGFHTFLELDDSLPWLVFCIPLTLIVFQLLGPPWLRRFLTIITPALAICLLLVFAHFVLFLTFDLFEPYSDKRAYGCAVALVSIGLFVVATSGLAFRSRTNRFKNV